MSATFTTAELNETLPALRRFALSLTRNEDRADDLVQDSVERALRKADYYEPGTNFRSWMFTLCRRLFLNDIRKQKSRGVAVELDDAPQSRVAEAPHQEHVAAFHELEESFQKLPENDKAVITMIAINGMKYEEAAEELGVPVGTIRSRLSRARARLKEMTDRDDDPSLAYAA